MRRIGTCLAIAASLALVGCGARAIDGSVETVVDEAQEVSSDETVNVTVSGYVDLTPSVDSDGSMTVMLRDDEFDNVVYCMFEDATETDAILVGTGRVTIKGVLSTGTISNSSVILHDCEVV